MKIGSSNIIIDIFKIFRYCKSIVQSITSLDINKVFNKTFRLKSTTSNVKMYQMYKYKFIFVRARKERCSS